MLEMFSSPEENRREGGHKEGSTATACYTSVSQKMLQKLGNSFETWPEQNKAKGEAGVGDEGVGWGIRLQAFGQQVSKHGA